ncbi:hypothetical protein SUGI_0356560 [Cryptomeria japonica]|nr:hypothetical protein SUGI_0356560 [Cryptomeria japonica]
MLSLIPNCHQRVPRKNKMKYNSFPSIPQRRTTFLPTLLFLFVINFRLVISTVSHTCDNSSTFTDGSTYSTNLNLVINDLFLNAPRSSGFNISSHGQSPNRVYGLLQCTGNISALSCSKCALEANSSIHELCANDIGGRIWLGDCFLRYHNYNFISILDTNGYLRRNQHIITGEAFKSTTSSLLSNLSNQAYIPANKGFAAGSANYSASGILYGLVQCWRDISIQDCRSCLFDARTNLNGCCSSYQGAQAQYGSCKVRYEIVPFFGSAQSPSPSSNGSATNTSTPPAASTPAPAVTLSPPAVAPFPNTVNGTSSTTSKGKSSKTLPIVLSLVGGIILTLALYLTVLRKKVKSVIYGRATTTTPDNREGHGFSSESGLLMQEQQFAFSLDMLAEATENFHDKNKLGQGGFGAVYKGITRNGNEIAVKKLSAKSAQGNKEFMNEVKLVANVQHRNLAKLLGCCAEGNERLLVYEYFPNKSLDTFLFDSEKGRELDWQKRYSIIVGITRGLLYLHEDSQLRIIHRDIKVNNILLDHKLNAKIADFGLAKLFPEDETHIHTRVAGTYGYMAPEYAMRGQLSIKVDVYSFGVVVLEIISGRKNSDTDLPHHMQNLLEWAWKIFNRGNALNLADATLRPAMSNVNMMLSSNLVTLPNPSNPAYISNSESYASTSRSKSSSGFEEHERGTTSQTTSGTTTSSFQRIPSINETSLTQMEAR